MQSIDAANSHLTRLFAGEILFSFLSAVVVSVITGIICDTFGELRGDQDEAEAFQGSTNFITGIDFAEIPEEKSCAHCDAHASDFHAKQPSLISAVAVQNTLLAVCLFVALPATAPRKGSHTA
eukprot:SAG31_NODE_172_length_21357_cov_7.616021_10_plen_123_part_00